VMNVLPRRGREAIGRFLKADQVLAGADPTARAAYEDRAAHSAPTDVAYPAFNRRARDGSN